MLEGRIGDCCEGHPPDVASTHGLLGGPQHGSFDSFSSMGASLDSEQHAAAAPHHGYKHSFVKASQIVPYVPLRRGGRAHGPAAFDHLPEVTNRHAATHPCLIGRLSPSVDHLLSLGNRRPATFPQQSLVPLCTAS